MGLLGFLRFLLKYWFYDLAWPLFALVYPLYASIKAIEANSVLETQKLNTYWVVFSLILLIEHALKLLEWFPFWPYIRLITVCSLVIPYFDGAFYVYKQFICPLLSVDPQVVINWFPKPKQTSLERETILAEVEKYIKENGTEALEKIIACKSGSPNNPEVKEIKAVSPVDGNVVDQPNSNEPNVARNDIKAVEVTEKNEVKAAIQVSQERKLAQAAENRTSFPAETKETVAEVTVGRDFLPQIPARATENRTSLPTETKETVAEVTVGRDCLPQTLAWATENRTSLPAETKETVAEVTVGRDFLPQIPARATENRTSLPTETKETVAEVTVGREQLPQTLAWATENQTSLPTQTPAPKIVQKEWICPTCHVTANSLTNFISHLQGRKHKAKEEAAKAKSQTFPLHDRAQGKPKINVPASSSGKASIQKHKEGPKTSVSNSGKAPVARPENSSHWCRICNRNCTSIVDLESHLKGKKHLNQVQMLSSHQ